MLTAKSLRRCLEPLDSPQGPAVRVGTEILVNFSSNDYLGLAADGRLREAAKLALDRHGVGSGASRLVVGDTVAHAALEQRLAEFAGSQAAILFNSGYAANLGILSALCGGDDVIFSDQLNHASLVDGCRLSKARTVVFPHRDLAALERLLQTCPGRRRLVCTDAVFSMDGDLAPLRELVALCRRYGAASLVDEAHAIGVLGPNGAGLSAALGIAAEVDLRMGTLGKAFGSFGAYVATSTTVRELLLHRARSLVYSTSLPPSLCAAAHRAIDLTSNDASYREKLWQNIFRFAQGLVQIGIGAKPQSAIFPILLGAPEAALEAASRLRAKGVLAKAIRPPTVPEGTSRLRFVLSAAHTFEQIDLALSALHELEIRDAR